MTACGLTLTISRFATKARTNIMRRKQMAAMLKHTLISTEESTCRTTASRDPLMHQYWSHATLHSLPVCIMAPRANGALVQQVLMVRPKMGMRGSMKSACQARMGRSPLT
jgi:hypothetical protein